MEKEQNECKQWKLTHDNSMLQMKKVDEELGRIKRKRDDYCKKLMDLAFLKEKNNMAIESMSAKASVRSEATNSRKAEAEESLLIAKERRGLFLKKKRNPQQSSVFEDNHFDTPSKILSAMLLEKMYVNNMIY